MINFPSSPQFKNASIGVPKTANKSKDVSTTNHADSIHFSSRNALHIAAEANNIAEMQELMEDGVSSDELNEQDDDGNTPLHLAALHGALQAVRVLLGRRGIDRNIRNYEAQTPTQMTTNGDILHLFNKAAGGF